jgi:hypothetical protein
MNVLVILDILMTGKIHYVKFVVRYVKPVIIILITVLTV